MKKYNKLSRFPLGSIQPIGYLKDQMLRGKDGMCGHLHELEPEMLYHPYIDKNMGRAFSGRLGCGNFGQLLVGLYSVCLHARACSLRLYKSENNIFPES